MNLSLLVILIPITFACLIVLSNYAILRHRKIKLEAKLKKERDDLIHALKAEREGLVRSLKTEREELFYALLAGRPDFIQLRTEGDAESKFFILKARVLRHLYEIDQDLANHVRPIFSKCDYTDLCERFEENIEYLQGIANDANNPEHNSRHFFAAWEQMIDIFPIVIQINALSIIFEKLKLENKKYGNIENDIIIQNDKVVNNSTFGDSLEEIERMLNGETRVATSYMPFDIAKTIDYFEGIGRIDFARKLCKFILDYQIKLGVGWNPREKYDQLLDTYKIHKEQQEKEDLEAKREELAKLFKLPDLPGFRKEDKPTPKSKPVRWVSQNQLYEIVCDLFPDCDVKTEFTAPWLNSQRLDIFIPEKNLAIEYHGKQHFLPVEFFGGEQGLRKTRRLDILKYNRCLEKDIALIYFSFDEDLSVKHVRERLQDYLPPNQNSRGKTD
jgi:hypothetical protein